MVKNEKGFTIVELLAIIIITSIIIVPLMQSMIDNIGSNHILHTRRSATSIADGALYGFDKLDYTDLEGLQDASNNVQLDYYTEFNATNCTDLAAPDDETICDALFGSTFNDVSFTSAQFRAFIYDYNLSSARQSVLVSDTDIPSEVRTEIGSVTPSTDPNPGLLRITVWIQYSDDPYRVVVISGLLIGDWSEN